MFPIRDTIPSKTYPVVNYILIGMNVYLFLVQLTAKGGLGSLTYHYGLVPARYTSQALGEHYTIWQQALPFLSFMFLHGGFLHLIGNMWSLYVFGDNVEDTLGHMGYIVFYLLCGVISGWIHLMFNLQSTVPVIGASGAIAGVMGAYFILYPKSRILTMIPIIIIPWFIEIPAFFFIGVWFLLQVFNAADGAGASGIAWWAHIGGFGCGIVLLKYFNRMPQNPFAERLREATIKKKSHHFQVIHPKGWDDGDAHLYGTIQITPYESLSGTRKIVNIPWGFQQRLYRVEVPQGIQEGQNIRLPGLGKLVMNGRRGDLFLEVVIRRSA